MKHQSNSPLSTSASAAVAMLREATAALSRNKEGNSSNEPFWEASPTVLLKNTSDLYKMVAIAEPRQ